MHIEKFIAPKIKQLSNGYDVLTWESSPGSLFTKIEKKLSSSLPLILSLALPAIVGGIWYVHWYSYTTDETVKIIPWYVAEFGLFLLSMATFSASIVSTRHEGR